MSTVSTVLPACDDPLQMLRALESPIRFARLLEARKAYAADHPQGLRAWFVYGALMLTDRGGVGAVVLDPPAPAESFLLEVTKYFDYAKSRSLTGSYATTYRRLPNPETVCASCQLGFSVEDYGDAHEYPIGPYRHFHAACWRHEQALRMKVWMQSAAEVAELPLIGAKLYLCKNPYDPKAIASEGYPWVRLQLAQGTILIGFRRHVWSIDYSDLDLDIDLFTAATTTHRAGLIHVNDRGDLVGALKTIGAALAARA